MISMGCNIVNKTPDTLTGLTQMAEDFFPYAKEQMGFDQPVCVVLQSDSENAGNILGKTAHYDPNEMAITLFTDGRHPKDILRSLSHELVHHSQNCRGEFDSVGELGPGYAQKDDHMREMEREAYEKGNLVFRDWEDLFKQRTLQENMNKKVKVTKEQLTELIEEVFASTMNELMSDPTLMGGSPARVNVSTPRPDFLAPFKAYRSWASDKADRGLTADLEDEVKAKGYEIRDLKTKAPRKLKTHSGDAVESRGLSGIPRAAVGTVADVVTDPTTYDFASMPLIALGGIPAAAGLAWDAARTAQLAKETLPHAPEMYRDAFKGITKRFEQPEIDMDETGRYFKDAEGNLRPRLPVPDPDSKTRMLRNYLPSKGDTWKGDWVGPGGEGAPAATNSKPQGNMFMEKIGGVQISDIIKEELIEVLTSIDEIGPVRGVAKKVLPRPKFKPVVGLSDEALELAMKSNMDDMAEFLGRTLENSPAVRDLLQGQVDDLTRNIQKTASYGQGVSADDIAQLKAAEGLLDNVKKMPEIRTTADDLVRQASPEAIEQARKRTPDAIYNLQGQFDYDKFGSKLRSRSYEDEIIRSGSPREVKYAGEKIFPEPTAAGIERKKLYDTAIGLDAAALGGDPAVQRTAREAARKLYDFDAVNFPKVALSTKIKRAPGAYKQAVWDQPGIVGKGISGLSHTAAIGVPTTLAIQRARNQSEEATFENDPLSGPESIGPLGGDPATTTTSDTPDEPARPGGPTPEDCRAQKMTYIPSVGCVVKENEMKDIIKRMVIEALKKQKVNEQPLTPTGLPPKPDTMDVKVDMDPDPKPAEAPPAERLTPSEKEDMEMSEDIEFESAQDLKEKIAEEKFNKLVKAITKK